MRRYTLGLLVVVALLGALASAAAGAPSESQRDAANGGDTGRFIVVLDHGDPHDVAADHRRDQDARVAHVYTTALRGYAAQMSERAAERVARDDRVAYVDRDAEVEALHHECGHSGGPPGSGSGPCETGAVGGTVTDDTGTAIDSATVTLDGATDHSTQTDANGDYLITDVATGDYTATADATGYEAQSQPITVTAGATTTADFSLTPASEGGSQTVPWGVERIGAGSLHTDHTGQGVSVYVIDSGIQADHPDLQGNLGAGHAVVECHKTGGATCAAPWDDDHGHGTHVGGTAAALDNDQGVVGVAPEATLHAVKVLDRRGRGWRSDVIAGIDWVAQQEASTAQPAVANMSLGGSGSKTATCDANGFSGSDSYHEAICAATHQGVAFAVAAGNSDEDASGTVPAAYDDTVMTISATTCDLLGAEEDQICDDGSDGWATFSNHGDVVTVGAPGEDVLSTWIGSGYHVGSGTSMASPHAAGTAALLIGAGDVTGSGYDAFTQTQAAIVNSAEDTSGWDDLEEEHDEGFLDAAAAVSGGS